MTTGSTAHDPWPPPQWDPPSPGGPMPPPPPLVAVSPRPPGAAVWTGICALAGLVGAASGFVPYVVVDEFGHAGLDPWLHDRLSAAGVSTTGPLIVLLGSLLALGVAAVMMRALDRDSAMNWRLTGLAMVVAGGICAWGVAVSWRAVETVFGSPDPDVWSAGIPLAALAATTMCIVGGVLMFLPSHQRDRPSTVVR